MIEIKSLVKVYKTGDEEVRAIDDITFNIEQGEIVAFSGASGSGKTTLLNLIGTLDNITSGDIIINENSIANMNEKQKTVYRKLNLGFIFQSYNLTQQVQKLYTEASLGTSRWCRKTVQEALQLPCASSSCCEL